MNPRNIQFNFGRFNLIASYSDKAKFLEKGLRTNKFLILREFEWGFFDIGKLSTNSNDDFLTGYLVKYKPNEVDEVVDTKKRKLLDQVLNNSVRSKARFFLHIKSGIIAYHCPANHISQKQFKKNFSKLFESAFDGFFVSSKINTIEEKFEIFEALKKFEILEKIEISLHPSNPSNREIWKHLDNRFKQLSVSTYKEIYTAKPNSNGLIDVEQDNEIHSKIHMSLDGYGETIGTGQINSKRKRVSTDDVPIIMMAPNDSVPPKIVLEYLMETFKKIFDRFSNEV
ncbi:MAG: hypothetical protein SCALA702_01190 [Melioribacteraceae bacterium]|nr:MAG: hypothetical protein SCALA702_01190 [Melioribacteraceae bacterium]